MILSKYNSYIEDYPFENGVTIFGLINKQMAFIENKDLLTNPDLIDDGTRKHMYVNNLIFFDTAEEEQYIKEVMNEKFRTENCLDITVVTSQNCNLKCIYCFEGESHSQNMSIDVCDTLLRSIDNDMEFYHKDRLYIHYYGGEPLMNIPIIRKMNRYLSDKYANKFTFGLVSNGVLLTQELVDEWTAQGFSRIKITLDGNKEFNDCRRIAKDGKSVYDQVMRNIDFLPPNSENILHLVVDQSNCSHIETMLKDLVARGYRDKLCISISYTHPNFEVPAKERAALVLDVAWLVKKYGFQQSYLIGVDGEGICPHKDSNAYLVDVNGMKYKCTGFMGLKNDPIGQFHDYNDKYINDDPECLVCKYLPACNGGCIYIKALRGGKKYCQREYFDALLPDLLKVYVDFELSDC